MIDIAAEEAVNGRCGEESHVMASVVAACEAGFAGVAYQAGFNGYAVADLEVFDARVDGKDFAG